MQTHSLRIDLARNLRLQGTSTGTIDVFLVEHITGSLWTIRPMTRLNSPNPSFSEPIKCVKLL